MEKPESLPEFAKAIRAVRDSFKWNQAQLAENMGLDQAEISRWESGRREPSRQIYEELYMLAYDRPEAKLFWERARLTPEKVQRWADAAKYQLENPAPSIKSEVVAAPGTYEYVNQWAHLKAVMGEPIAVPLLSDAAAAGMPRLINSAVEDGLFLSAKWLPHPGSTRCFRVAGDSMAPVLKDGYIVVVDTFVRDANSLRSKMVLASDPSGGGTVKWLRKIGKKFMLVPQHTSPRYNPVILDDEPGWRIEGEVMFWIGRPYPARK